MHELQVSESYEQQVLRLTELSGRFFSAWADDHTQMDDIGRLPFNPLEFPFQNINHHKSFSMAAQHDIDPEAYLALMNYNLSRSFSDEHKFQEFINEITKPYPYPGGNGRSFIEVLADDYLRGGLSVAATLGHPEDRLTDSPRFVCGLAYGLGSTYGLEFAKDLGLVAGAPLKFETYKDNSVDTMLTVQSDVYYTATQSKNTEKYRQRAGLSAEELQEIYTFMNLGVGRTIMQDVRPKKPQDDGLMPHGKLVVFNPTATRADIVCRPDGQPVSITLPSVQENTARLMASFQAYWPVVVLGDHIKLGPIIPISPLPKHHARPVQNIYSLQRVEDSMDIVAGLANQILKQDGVAVYKRNTQRGDIYFNYSPALISGWVGRRLLAATQRNGSGPA